MYNTGQSKRSVDLCTEWNSIVLWVLDGGTWETAVTTTSLYIHMRVKLHQACPAKNRCVCVCVREILPNVYIAYIKCFDQRPIKGIIATTLIIFSSKDSKMNS